MKSQSKNEFITEIKLEAKKDCFFGIKFGMFTIQGNLITELI